MRPVKIRIKNLLVRTFIGFNPEELVNKQDVIINLEVDVSVPKEALHADQPIGIYDYRTLTKEVIEFVEEERFKLLEVLTAKIVDMIMDDKRVTFVRVEADKPNALRFAESVSCLMEAHR